MKTACAEDEFGELKNRALSQNKLVLFSAICNYNTNHDVKILFNVIGQMEDLIDEQFNKINRLKSN